ncbi:MAG: choice-of-anchor D domain-containing protein, partial [Ignavibacteriaceae bacterium]
MKITVTLVILFLTQFIIIGQGGLYQGPAMGNIPGGATVSTDNFAKTSPIQIPRDKKVRNPFKFKPDPQQMELDEMTAAAEINYFEDPALVPSAVTSESILLSSWDGMAETNSIPPDPYVAAGPSHIVTTVNSSFAIWDKFGNLLKNIEANDWYQSVLPRADAFDPKVFYDHFSKRWVMVWLHKDEDEDDTKQAFFLVSVSDDSIPTGTWYNWALPSYKNGNTLTTTWADYQGVGFDDKAIYITSNQWQFGGGFNNAKLRILPKESIYNSSAAEVTWFDLWNISYTGQNFTMRPSISYTADNNYFLLQAQSQQNSHTYFTLYKVSNPTTNPSLSAENIYVSRYSTAPDANQLGGSSSLIDAGYSYIRHEVIYRDGFLWAVHSAKNPEYDNYSSLHYVKINTANNTTVEDYFFGAAGYWHYYPNLSVDKDHNVAITYSRSGNNEYPGAFYISRLNNDPPGFSGSKPLQAGKANYVKDLGSGRNRWGDYNGIWLDPSDQNNFWLFTEYSAGVNTWGTWVGQIRLVPFPGVYLQTSRSSVDFGNVEVNTASNPVTVEIKNLGEEDLVISSIQNPGSAFNLISELTFPITLSSYETVSAVFTFSPSAPGVFSGEISIISNNPSVSVLELEGTGFRIKAAEDNVFYASSGSANDGNILTVNVSSGQGTVIGPSLYQEIKSLAVQPKTNIIYGLVSNVNPPQLVRVNAENGNSYTSNTFPLSGLFSISFDTSGNLYGAARTGEIYSLNIVTGEFEKLCSVKTFISSIAFDPLTNELWGSAWQLFGSEKDKIFKINLTTGDTVLIGKTGLKSNSHNSIAFDNNGNLYGIIAGTSIPGDTSTTIIYDTLVSIDKTTGTGSKIGSLGFSNMTGLAFSGTLVTSAGKPNTGTIPQDFTLKQNYPNPFNPSTTIEYGLPVNSRVKLNIYNLLGENVAELINSEQSAGNYTITWN